MIKSIRALAWLRDLVIGVLFVTGIELLQSSTRLASLLLLSASVIFVERFLWSWHLLDLRDEQDSDR
jgi:hypothetical protein